MVIVSTELAVIADPTVKLMLLADRTEQEWPAIAQEALPVWMASWVGS